LNNYIINFAIFIFLIINEEIDRKKVKGEEIDRKKVKGEEIETFCKEVGCKERREEISWLYATKG
jgi:hypothetical protein